MKYLKLAISITLIAHVLTGWSQSLDSSAVSSSTLSSNLKKSALDQKIDDLENTTFPPFSTVNIEYDSIFSDQLLGKVIHINVWSKTCGGCIIEIPQLNQLKAAYNDKVIFLGLTPDTPEEATAFLKKHDFHFEIIPDSKAILDTLGINIQPLNIFLDSNGTIKRIKYGLPVSLNPSTGKNEISVFTTYADILNDILKE